MAWATSTFAHLPNLFVQIFKIWPPEGHKKAVRLFCFFLLALNYTRQGHRRPNQTVHVKM